MIGGHCRGDTWTRIGEVYVLDSLIIITFSFIIIEVLCEFIVHSHSLQHIRLASGVPVKDSALPSSLPAPATPTQQDPALPSPAQQPPQDNVSVRVITDANPGDNPTVEGLRGEVRQLQSQLATEQEAHKADRKRLEDVIAGGSGKDLEALPTPPEEMTIRTEGASAERTIRTTPSGKVSPGVAPEDNRELSQLTQQLKAFCHEAQRISLPM